MELPKLRDMNLKVGDSMEKIGYHLVTAKGNSSPQVMLVPSDEEQRERILNAMASELRNGIEGQVAKKTRVKKAPVVIVGVPKQGQIEDG